MLYQDVWNIIFEFCDTNDLMMMRLVCKNIKNYIGKFTQFRNDTIIKNIKKFEKCLGKQNVITIYSDVCEDIHVLSECDYLETINITFKHTCHNVQNIVISPEMFPPNIKHINIFLKCITKFDGTNLFKLKQLRSLCIDNMTLCNFWHRSKILQNKTPKDWSILYNFKIRKNLTLLYVPDNLTTLKLFECSLINSVIFKHLHKLIIDNCSISYTPNDKIEILYQIKFVKISNTNLYYKWLYQFINTTELILDGTFNIRYNDNDDMYTYVTFKDINEIVKKGQSYIYDKHDIFVLSYLN